MGWGVCERVLKPHLSRKGLRGKAKAKTGIGKSDLPGLQGGPRKRDSVSYDPVRAPRLYPDPEEPSFQVLTAIGLVINLLLLTIRLKPEGTFTASR